MSQSTMQSISILELTFGEEDYRWWYVLVTCNNCWLVMRQRDGTEESSGAFIMLFVIVI